MKRLLLIFLACALFAQFGKIEGQSIINARPFHRAVATAAPGANMVSNGTFDNGDDWTLSSSYTIAGGVLVFDNVTPATAVQTDGQMVTPLSVETDYTVSFDIISGTGSYVVIQNAAQNVVYVAGAVRGVGSYSFNITSPDNLQGGGICIYCLDNTTFTLDNLVIVPR
jgi:hypothetical protein